MARHLIPKAVTVSDVVSCLGGKTPKPIDLPKAECSLPKPTERAVNFKPKSLPLWRKIIAVLSMLLVASIFVYAVGITDLSSLIGKDGISELGKEQLHLYLVLFVSLIAFLLAIGRRSPAPITLQIPKEKRKLGKRTVFASLCIVICIPLTIFIGVYYLDNQYYNVISLIVLMECILPFLVVFEGRKPKARELVTIAVLCAIGIAGRSSFFMLPQFKPVMVLTIIAGVAFGGEVGFLVGAFTMLAFNILFTQVPWTPWQMFSMGIIGFLAGILFRKGFLRRSRGALATFGAFSAVMIYGGIMNLASAIMWSPASLNKEIILSYYISGLPMDLIHAAATVIFIIFAAEPMLEKLDHLKLKYGLNE